MVRVFTNIIILAFAYLGYALCDAEDLAFKLQKIVNQLNVIITKLDSKTSMTEVSSTIAAGNAY
jgi:hypothetical protein